MYSSLCAQCLKFVDTSTFVDAVSKSVETATATVCLARTLSDVAETAAECEICKLILGSADRFEDEFPEIQMEFVFGSEKYDIKAINLSYQGPVSGEHVGFATGYNYKFSSYMFHALPGMFYFRL